MAFRILGIFLLCPVALHEHHGAGSGQSCRNRGNGFNGGFAQVDATVLALCAQVKRGALSTARVAAPVCRQGGPDEDAEQAPQSRNACRSPFRNKYADPDEYPAIEQKNARVIKARKKLNQYRAAIKLAKQLGDSDSPPKNENNPDAPLA